MTSKPASRSARAMIFAPRSCPSRPGLATRILSRLSATSDPTWISVDAEFGAEHVADLAHRAVAPHRLAYRLHQILARAAGLCDAGERLARGPGIALALEPAHALHLHLLERRIDLE